MNAFELNPQMKARVQWIGNKEAPLFCIDDVYADPDAVAHYAKKMEYPTSEAFYPGRHQSLGNDIDGILDFKKHIGGLVGQAIRKTVTPEGVETDFSIVTTPEYKLLGQQGQPHIDGVPMLGVIYLNDEDFGGTVFFRNKQTGSASVITPEQQEHYQSVAKGTADLQNKNAYITRSDENWDVIHTTDGRKNCLVMWPGTVWHSINVKIPPQKGDIEAKRLTQRVIVNQAH